MPCSKLRPPCSATLRVTHRAYHVPCHKPRLPCSAKSSSPPGTGVHCQAAAGSQGPQGATEREQKRALCLAVGLRRVAMRRPRQQHKCACMQQLLEGTSLLKEKGRYPLAGTFLASLATTSLALTTPRSGGVNHHVEGKVPW